MRSLIGNMLPPPVTACPAPDSSSADPQPLRQHVGNARRAKLRGHTLGRQPGDDRVIHGGLAPRHALAPFPHAQQLRRRQAVQGQRRELGVGGLELVERPRDGVAIRQRTRVHARKAGIFAVDVDSE